MKKRKYNPKPVNPLAHIVAMRGAALLHKDDVLRCAMNVHAAVDAIRQGQADKDKWQDLFMAINIMEELVRMGKAKDDGALDQMQEAVVAVLDRQKSTGSKALRDDELATLRDVAATYTDLLSGITHSELFEAHERSRARVKRVLANPTADARLVTAPEDA